MSSPYRVPKHSAIISTEVKKSRFIAHAIKVTSRQQCLDYAAELASKHPTARHNCWAYIIGNPKFLTDIGSFDDQEPVGSAGKPILNVLEHANIGDIAVIVTRYFGGIKLGIGGLIRAYGAATKNVLEQLELEQHLIMHNYKLYLNYAQEALLHQFIAQQQGAINNIDYTLSDYDLVANISLPNNLIDELNNQLQGACRIDKIDD